MVTGLHPRCPLPPTLTLPLGAGEGRVGVMFLMSFLQRLGELAGKSAHDYFLCKKPVLLISTAAFLRLFSPSSSFFQ